MDQDQHPHGVVKRYRAGCKCQPCRDAWATYHRERRAGPPAPRAGRGSDQAGPGLPSARAADAAGQLAAEGARLAELWAAEAPAVRAIADLEGLAGHPCQECGGPLYWSGAHTVLLCPSTDHADGRAHVMPSPEAQRREAEHAEARSRRGADGGGQLAGPDAAERDQLAREAHLERRELARRIAALAGHERFTAEARDILDWYKTEADKTDSLPPAAALDRLEQLAAALDAEKLPRRGFWAAVTPAELFAEWLSGDDEGQADAEDQADAEAGSEPPRFSPRPPPRPVRQAPAGGFCRGCGARYDPSAPGICPCGRADFTGPHSGPTYIGRPGADYWVPFVHPLGQANGARR